MNSLRFNRNFNDSPDESCNLETKIKRSFLNEKYHGSSAKQKTTKNYENEKGKVTEFDKLKIHESFYESFRIVKPKGITVKSLNLEQLQEETKKEALFWEKQNGNENKNEKEIRNTDNEGFENEDDFETFTKKMEENDKKYDYASLVNDEEVIKLLKQIVKHQESKYQSNNPVNSFSNSTKSC